MSKVRDAARPAEGPALALMRRAAASLRGTPDHRTLASTLNELMQLWPVLRSAWIELPMAANADAAVTPSSFSGDALTLPLRAGAEVAGVLRHQLAGGPVDGERLRLLGAIAELLGAILEQTTRAVAAEQARALLVRVLAHVPFGVACFSGTGALLAANAPARQFAGNDATLAALLLPPGAKTGGHVTHVARVEGHVALVHLHPAVPADPLGGVVALVFDLGRQAREFLDVVARETYRALWLGRPLSLAVLAAPGNPGELLRLAGAISARLPVGAAWGPLEADAVAILAPETSLATLRTIVRGATDLDDVRGLRLGIAELERAHHQPESFVTAAVEALAPLLGLHRPSVLLCDTSPSVTEALQVALRIDCDSVRCHDRETGWRLLGERSFDAIFAKVELDEWDRDISFLRRALELQPDLKPFIVTDASGLYSATIPDLPAGTPVFRKPFLVSAVRHAVREQLAQRIPSR